MTTLYQYGAAGTPSEYREFFKFPAISLDEMRSWIKDGAGDDAIGLGAVVNAKGEIVGELVMPGGKDAYMVDKAGNAMPVPADHKITFAQIGCMAPEIRAELDVTSKDDLQAKLAALLPEGKRDAYMVRVTGALPNVEFRTVDTQGKTIDTLPGLLSKETSFTKTYTDDKNYQLVGLYSKKDAVESGVTFDDVLHLHGLDQEHHQGGHLNNFSGNTHVTVELMPITEWLTATREAAQAQGQEAIPASISWADRMAKRSEASADRSLG